MGKGRCRVKGKEEGWSTKQRELQISIKLQLQGFPGAQAQQEPQLLLLHVLKIDFPAGSPHCIIDLTCFFRNHITRIYR